MLKNKEVLLDRKETTLVPGNFDQILKIPQSTDPKANKFDQILRIPQPTTHK